MSTLRMDHVVVVVDDLESAKAFFLELGLEVEGEMPIQGEWADRINAIDGLHVDICMLRTPDGSGKLELTRFHHPAAVDTGRESLPNTLGYRSVMFEVDDVDAVVERLRSFGGDLIGEIVDYEDVYRLCYVSGPAGVIVALAETLG